MERFTCICESKPELFFTSTTCIVCGRLTGFCYDRHATEAFEPTKLAGKYVCTSTGATYRQCENYASHSACNGMINNDQNNEEEPQTLCFACHFNETIPDLSVPEHLPLWRKMETAKRQALYTLTSLGLPLPDKQQEPEMGLSFNFTTDKDASDHFQSQLPNCEPVFTGHDKGEITINLAEADSVALASNKSGLSENYRTLLGHFRHELGHYFWDRLVEPNEQSLKEYRSLFGDEREDYQEALDRHYKNGPPQNWPENHISAYATMHPWEDWAETWAHYLHMIDTLETAQAFGFEVDQSQSPLTNDLGKNDNIEELNLPQETSAEDTNGYRKSSITTIIDNWIQLSIGLNALNRSMGLEDAYPFVLTPVIRDKLALVHKIIHDAR